MSRADTDPQRPAGADPQGPAGADSQGRDGTDSRRRAAAVPKPRRGRAAREQQGEPAGGEGSEVTVSGTDDTAGLAATQESTVGDDPRDGRVARAPWAGWDPVIRIAGVVIATVAAFVSGALELLLTTLRAGDVVSVWGGHEIGSGGGPLLGLSILLAVVLNYGIARFAVTTTDRRWAVGPPWALWTLLMLFAAGVRTDEGDYLLGGENWIALVTILVGSVTFAMYSYRMILKGPRR
jgi:hypothetical protein